MRVAAPVGVGLITLAALLLLALAWACGGSDAPPYHPGSDLPWKPRAVYCFSILSDPRGDHNTRSAFSDSATLEDGVVRATNVRVTQFYGHHRTAKPSDDYFRTSIAWTLDDGRLEVSGRCAPEDTGYANN